MSWSTQRISLDEILSHTLGKNGKEKPQMLDKKKKETMLQIVSFTHTKTYQGYSTLFSVHSKYLYEMQSFWVCLSFPSELIIFDFSSQTWSVRYQNCKKLWGVVLVGCLVTHLRAEECGLTMYGITAWHI